MSCEKPAEELEISRDVDIPLTRGAALSKEANKRLAFLEQEVGISNLTTDNFVLAYQKKFDPKGEIVDAKSNCSGCNYIPSNCDEFDLYVQLLFEGCRDNDNGPVDYCSLYEDCINCRDETCGSPESDPCLNVNCPAGTICDEGVCVVNETDCERVTRILNDYLALSDDEIIASCGFSGSTVPSRWSRELWRCPLFLKYNEALSDYLKLCSNGTCFGCP